MGRTAWFHCFAGTAGDMTLGALVHAGADPLVVADLIGRLPIEGCALTFEPVQRCGIAATHAVVVTATGYEHAASDPDDRAHARTDVHPSHEEAHARTDVHPSHEEAHARTDDAGSTRDHDHGHDHGHEHGHAHPAHRPYREIRAMLDAADLPDRVRDRAQRTFRLLAEVEGQMHRIDPDDVELHEVGSLDAIVDVVGACAALEALDVERILCSPITVGQGTVRAAHGTLPNPAPATMELLARRNAPTRGIDDRRELATPTGVALMVALADEFGPLPALDVLAVGYGAGTLDIAGRPNVVQVVVGETAAVTVTPAPGQPVQLLETNVDDATGEVLAHTIAALLAAGAHDAWATPIVMKKGRPAHTVHALCDPAATAAVGAVLVRETGTLGLRGMVLARWPQSREERTVDVGGHAVRVKVGAERVKAEHDDAAAAAAALGWPLRDVLHAAESAAAAGRMQP